MANPMTTAAATARNAPTPADRSSAGFLLSRSVPDGTADTVAVVPAENIDTDEQQTSRATGESTRGVPGGNGGGDFVASTVRSSEPIMLTRPNRTAKPNVIPNTSAPVNLGKMGGAQVLVAASQRVHGALQDE